VIQFHLDYCEGFVRETEWRMLQPTVTDLHARLQRKDVPGSDFLGWIHLPSMTLASGIQDVLAVAEEIRNEADALVVIGIGGSYLGARAAFEWCKPQYYNQLPKSERKGPELYFAGNHLSASALAQLMRLLTGKKVYLNVISKSGTTTEPAVAFRVLRAWLMKECGDQEAKKRIIVTTDRAKGALKKLADEEGYRTFVIPDDVGGRFSVLTPVGLLPLASVGIDIEALLKGALQAEKDFSTASLEENAAYRYAAIRNALYRKGKTTEILAYYEPSLQMFAEWWKQLFGESEGKDGKGIYPASVGFTTDLHSMGQYIQEGYRNLFETVVHVLHPGEELTLPSDVTVDDGLEYLAGKPISWVNDQARVATHLAHVDGGVPNLLVTVEDKSPFALGELFYFFELACAMSGLLLGVNPFDQPGVEAYKVNMFALLGKPGYESHRERILGR
jgi:glucose-6-phosphate isomerase